MYACTRILCAGPVPGPLRAVLVRANPGAGDQSQMPRGVCAPVFLQPPVRGLASIRWDDVVDVRGGLPRGREQHERKQQQQDEDLRQGAAAVRDRALGELDGGPKETTLYKFCLGQTLVKLKLVWGGARKTACAKPAYFKNYALHNLIAR